MIDDVRPSTPAGYPAKAVVGERVPVRAVVFKEGHDVLAARALLFEGAGAEARLVEIAPLQLTGNDEWLGHVTPGAMGTHRVVVQGWTDRYATWAKFLHVFSPLYSNPDIMRGLRSYCSSSEDR